METVCLLIVVWLKLIISYGFLTENLTTHAPERAHWRSQEEAQDSDNGLIPKKSKNPISFENNVILYFQKIKSMIINPKIPANMLSESLARHPKDAGVHLCVCVRAHVIVNCV